MEVAKQERDQLGAVLVEWTAAQKARIIDAVKKLEEHEGTIEQAVDLWIKHRQAKPTLKSPAIGELIDGMLDAKATAGARPRYLTQIRWALKKFRDRFGGQKADLVTASEIESWLGTLKCAPVTRRGYWTDVRTLFSFARKRGWVLHNPADGVERIRIDESPVEIFSVGECRKLLDSCQKVSPNALACLAIGMFAGLRPSEIDRLPWSSIGEKYIEVHAKKVRSRQRRLVTIRPVLAAWLQIAPRQSPDWVRPENLVRMWRRMVKVSGVLWRHDALRHSFASYHLAECQDSAKTAHELGHFSQDMLFRHYRERVSAERAAEFWALFPQKE